MCSSDNYRSICLSNSKYKLFDYVLFIRTNFNIVYKYDITFNPTNTVYIKYGHKVKLNEHVVMNGNIIEWVDNVRHIGNFVDATLSDSLDCRYKRSMFIGYVNKLISKFGHL